MGPPLGPVARDAITRTPGHCQRVPFRRAGCGNRAARTPSPPRHQDTKACGTKRRGGAPYSVLVSLCLGGEPTRRFAVRVGTGFVVGCPDVAVKLGVLTAFIGLMLSVSEGGGWHGPS